MSHLISTHDKTRARLITIDNPPVNALGQSVRAGLIEALQAAQAAPGIDAIVLAGAGRMFSGGADIAEFGRAPLQPSLHDLIACIEALAKPVFIVLHGTTMGGGLELALACHYRLAAADARLGLPEIKLGLLPGAGGTQRLPRLIGPQKALRMIVSGEPVSAGQALADGLVDAVLAGDRDAAALDYVADILARGHVSALVRGRENMLVEDRADPSAFEAMAQGLTARARGQLAPQACVASLLNAFTLPIEQGLAREKAMFIDLLASSQSRAQRHVFFAEREAAKAPDLSLDIKPRDIASIAVIGAGTMGGGIAMCFANAGLPVSLIDTDPQALARGLATIWRNYAATAKRGGISTDEAARRFGLIAGAAALDAVASAGLVIEAVFEDMALKQAIFSDLDRLARPGCLLATNTSTLDINVIAAATSRPENVLGLHFFSPANVMRLVEVVRGAKTAPQALASAISIVRHIGKVPALVGVCDGFVGNRMLHVRNVESERLLLEGALPQDVDAALLDFGFPMGPFAMADLAGLDVGWLIRKGSGKTAAVADALCEMGRFGQKTGSGFFTYAQGSRVPVPDPEVERLILETAKQHGVTRRKISKDEILQRLLLPMINEGARILSDGIALRPGDIDVIWVYGYAWPAWRGGPMHYADTLGLDSICARLAEFAAKTGDARLKPAPLLQALAQQGGGFASLGKAGAARGFL